MSLSFVISTRLCSSRARESHLQFATLAGEFISIEGIIFGGTTSAENDSLLGRKARIDSLIQDREKLNEERRDCWRKTRSHRLQLESATRRLEEARRQHHAAQLAHSTASGQIKLSERELADAERKLEQLETERTTLEQQSRIADEKVTRLEGRIGDASQSTSRTRVATRFRRERAGKCSPEGRACERDAQELRLAVATERQRHESLVSHAHRWPHAKLN